LGGWGVEKRGVNAGFNLKTKDKSKKTKVEEERCYF